MTSESTYAVTKHHLEEVVADVGLSMEQVIIFSQAQIPVFDLEGKFLMDSTSSVATSPGSS